MGAGIIGIGLDIVAVARMRAAVRRSGARFVKKVFTPGEARYCSGRAREYEHLAARFAAKEAALKALGAGITGWAALQEVEVVREAGGRPRLSLRGGVLRRARSLGVTAAHLSLTHTDQFAAAVVVLEGGATQPLQSLTTNLAKVCTNLRKVRSNRIPSIRHSAFGNRHSDGG